MFFLSLRSDEFDHDPPPGLPAEPVISSWNPGSLIPMPTLPSLSSLLSLRGVTYEYKDPKAINELPGSRIGVIAQEVEQVFPDWVGVHSRGHKTVTFRGFEALTVEALRELREENHRQIAEKDTEMASLSDANSRLESDLAELRAQVEEFASLARRVADMEARLEAERAGNSGSN